MELPEELIEKIAREHLESYSQLIAFSHVCRSWRSIARRRPSLPGLLVPKSTSQSPLEEYYSSGIAHEFYPLATLCTATPPPIPRATLSFLPSPSKISDAMGLRSHYLHLHHNFVDKLTAPPSSSSSSSDDDDDNPSLSFWHHIDDDLYVPRSFEVPARSLGSKDGWILRTRPERHCGRYYYDDRRPQDLYLLNPITGASVPLRPLPAVHRRYDINKAMKNLITRKYKLHQTQRYTWFVLAVCKAYSTGENSSQLYCACLRNTSIGASNIYCSR